MEMEVGKFVKLNRNQAITLSCFMCTYANLECHNFEYSRAKRLELQLTRLVGVTLEPISKWE